MSFLIEIFIFFSQLIKLFLFQVLKKFIIFYIIFKNFKLNLKMKMYNMKMFYLMFTTSINNI
jgi:hypothetical protein